MISQAVPEAIAASLTDWGLGAVRAEDVMSELLLPPYRRSEIGEEAARMLDGTGMIDSYGNLTG